MKNQKRVDGTFEEFYEDGQLKENSIYKAGKADGPFESYYENGQLESKGSWEDGIILDSEYYYENGKLME